MALKSGSLRLADPSLLRHAGERKPLVLHECGVEGLYYIAAVIFAAVIRGGAWAGSAQPSFASSSC